MRTFGLIGRNLEYSFSSKYFNDKFLEEGIINTQYLNFELKDISEFNRLKNNKDLVGLNITMPYKEVIIPFLDELSSGANESQSVNTIYKKNNKIIGHNTDIEGFELGIRHFKYEVKNKKVFILGAGGVVSSIILALKRMSVSKIIISNRTKEKAQSLKKDFKNIEIIEWGEVSNFDMIINATSIGIKENEEIKLDYSRLDGQLFYDVIYNPPKTKFLENANKFGKKTENGKSMFIYQAMKAFEIWHGIKPKINEEVLDLIK